jgi:hypothetical protein
LLEDIIRTAWAWRAAHPQGFDGPAVKPEAA